MSTASEPTIDQRKYTRRGASASLEGGTLVSRIVPIAMMLAPARAPAQPGAAPSAPVASDACASGFALYTEFSGWGGVGPSDNGMGANDAGPFYSLRGSTGLFDRACTLGALDLRVGMASEVLVYHAAYGNKYSVVAGGEVQADWPYAGWRFGGRFAVSFDPAHVNCSYCVSPYRFTSLGARARYGVVILGADLLALTDSEYAVIVGVGVTVLPLD
jgi:hypothetical protein